MHGGAELPYSLGQELSNQEKAIKNVQKKLDIARQTAKLIAKQDVIFIDAGTTTELLIDFLPHEQLTVVTNSIHHSQQTFILMDSSKIGQVTFAKVKEINDINLVTNKTDSELMTIIKEKMKVIQV